MKKVYFILIFIFIVPSFGEAQKAIAPDSFLGFKWGSTIDEFIKLKDPGPEPSYSGLSDQPIDRFTSLGSKKDIRIGKRWLSKIGEVDVGSTGYLFNKNRFYMAIVHFKENKNYRILKDALILKYGRPHKISPLILRVNPNSKGGEECSWEIETVWITLKFNELKNEGLLQYSYMPIIYEGLKEEKQEAEKTKDSL